MDKQIKPKEKLKDSKTLSGNRLFLLKGISNCTIWTFWVITEVDSPPIYTFHISKVLPFYLNIENRINWKRMEEIKNNFYTHSFASGIFNWTSTLEFLAFTSRKCKIFTKLVHSFLGRKRKSRNSPKISPELSPRTAGNIKSKITRWEFSNARHVTI